MSAIICCLSLNNIKKTHKIIRKLWIYIFKSEYIFFPFKHSCVYFNCFKCGFKLYPGLNVLYIAIYPFSTVIVNLIAYTSKLSLWPFYCYNILVLNYLHFNASLFDLMLLILKAVKDYMEPLLSPLSLCIMLNNVMLSLV